MVNGVKAEKERLIKERMRCFNMKNQIVNKDRKKKLVDSIID
jgi:hypothetical protein